MTVAELNAIQTYILAAIDYAICKNFGRETSDAIYLERSAEQDVHTFLESDNES